MAGQALSIAAFIEAVTAEVISAVGVEGELPESGKSVSHRPDEEGGASVDGEPWLADGEGARNANAKSVPSHGFECEPTSPQAPVRIADAGPPARTETLPPPPFVVDLTRDLDTADAFELDARLCRAVRLETRQLAQLAGCLERAVAHGLPRALGFASLDAYAEERLAMAPSRARALLRVARAESECPPLRKAFGAGRLSWVQAHALVPLMFEPAAARHTRAWVAHAERVSVRRLCDDVERALAAGAFAPPTGAPRPHSDDLVLDRPHLQFGAERVRLFFAAPLEVAHLFRAALATVQRRLEHVRQRPASQGEALSAMLGHALDTWVAHDPHQTAPRDRRVFERDGWRCTVPGCSSYRNLHGHHIVFRSHSGSHALTNLTTLCAWHHQRGIHGSGLHAARIVSCGGRAPNALYFALGLRRHRSPLLTYGPGEVRIT
jgi:hypothetical protein